MVAILSKNGRLSDTIDPTAPLFNFVAILSKNGRLSDMWLFTGLKLVSVAILSKNGRLSDADVWVAVAFCVSQSYLKMEGSQTRLFD